jgi:TetR/AcrR family transcriptional regulator, regulator of autoinduction and epiphytic fitness
MKRNRKKRDTSLKHQIIIDGAIKVFIEHGFDHSSMDRISEVAGVSKRTIYNHFTSKESLFQAIVADFIKQRDQMKPIKYLKDTSLSEQLKTFAEAELFLINDPIRRGLSKLLTSIFLMNVEFGKHIKSQYTPYDSFIQWLNAAKEDQRLSFESPELTARIFYGLVEGCITWSALFTDGDSLKHADDLLSEVIKTFLSRYEC